MEDLIKILESFNRKERFYLLTYALGLSQDCKEPTLKLGKPFREALECKLLVRIPEDKVFVATDYHLNWIHASLYAASCGDKMPSSISGRDYLIQDSQQDVDLLMAFQTGAKYHLIFVEAKGYTSKRYANFGEREKKENGGGLKVINKFRRLKQIIDYHKDKQPVAIEPHFCLMSGNKSRNLEKIQDAIKTCLDISVKWLELPLPKNKWVVESLNGNCPRLTKICPSSDC